MLNSLSIQHEGKDEAAREKNIEKTREIKLLLQPPSRSYEAGWLPTADDGTGDGKSPSHRPIVPRLGIMKSPVDQEGDCPLIRDVHIAVFAMGTTQRLIQFFKGNSPLFLGNLFGEFRLAFITEPAVVIWGYPEFHYAFLP